MFFALLINYCLSMVQNKLLSFDDNAYIVLIYNYKSKIL